MIFTNWLNFFGRLVGQIMFVRIPWKKATFALRPDQTHLVQHDAKGLFLYVRNAHTNRLNKCRVVSSPKVTSPPKRSLDDLLGGHVVGTIAQTGPDYVALLVEQETELVRMAKTYLADRHVSWKVDAPRSWTLPISPYRQLGPHVSLHRSHLKDVGKTLVLTIVGVMHWKEAHRWVALKVKGPLKDHTDWILHLSCAQQPLPLTDTR